MWLAAVVALGLVGLLSASFLDNPLVFDDEYFFLQDAPQAFFSEGFALYPRWWVYESLAATFVWLGSDLLWLRLGNLALHIATALVLFGFVRQLLRDLDKRNDLRLGAEVAALLAACVFLIHPLTIFTQSYLIQRTIVCACLFGLLGLWLFWRGLNGSRWALWGSCLCMLLAMYAKEHAVMLPVLACVLAVLHKRSGLACRFTLRELFAVLAVQSLISFSVVLLVKGVIGTPYEVMTQEVLDDELLIPQGSLYLLSVLNQMGLFFNYLAVAVFPQASAMGIDLRVPFPLEYAVWWLWTGLFGFLAYGVGAGWLLFRGGSKGLLGFALLFPWVLFATELAAVRLQEPFALYRTYLWVPGLCIALALGLRRLKPFYLFTLTPFFAVYLLGLSYDRLTTMAEPWSVWSEAAERLEANAGKPGVFGGYRIYYNLGNAYYRLGLPDLAMESYAKAIAQKPRYGYAYHQLGIIYLDSREWGKAFEEFERAIALAPGHFKSYLAQAEVMQALGKPEKARLYLQTACMKGSRVACDRARGAQPVGVMLQ